MNYLSEINAFENWCECNYLPSTVKLLWYELMWLNNRTGWVEWFSAINPYVMCRIGVSSEPNFIKLRNHLKQMGRIEFKSGKKGQPTQYRMIFFNNTSVYTSKNEVKAEVKTEVNQEVKAEGETEDIINKDIDLNKKENKKKKTQPSGKEEYTSQFEEFWKSYPRPIGKKAAYANWNTQVKKGVDVKDLINACINYAKYCEYNETKEQYIAHPKTFLGPSDPFKDYINFAPLLNNQPVKKRETVANAGAYKPLD